MTSTREPDPGVRACPRVRARVVWLVGLVVALVVIVGGTWWVDRSSCGSAAEPEGLSWSWGPVSGCRVVVDGELVPLGELDGDGRYVEP